MFDTMTLTKIVGGVCGALLIFLFANWAGNSLFGFGEEGHSEAAEQAYSVAVAETSTDEATTEEAGPPFADLLAVADTGAGEKVFKKCATCHKIDGNNATGPHLNGVVGRPRGEAEGFAYSEGMLSAKGEPWTPELLNTFLTNPKAYVAGTKMSFAGLSKGEDRANVIAYLATTK